MGKRRRDKALGSSLEQRVTERKLHPSGAFRNGSSAALAKDKLIRKQAKEFKEFRKRAFPERLYLS